MSLNIWNHYKSSIETAVDDYTSLVSFDPYFACASPEAWIKMKATLIIVKQQLISLRSIGYIMPNQGWELFEMITHLF